MDQSVVISDIKLNAIITNAHRSTRYQSTVVFNKNFRQTKEQCHLPAAKQNANMSPFSIVRGHPSTGRAQTTTGQPQTGFSGKPLTEIGSEDGDSN